MEFGKVSPELINQVDFKLPPDPELTLKTLKEAEKHHVEAYVGCAKWGRKEWVGQIYPKDTKEANFLNEYVKHFNSIEMNSTFYKIYPPSTIKKWKDKAEANGELFKFCPKISRSISHIKRLKDAEELTTAFYEGIMAFEQFLGPIFLQLSDNFGPKNFDILKEYIAHLPKDFPVFAEVRHPDWFLPEHSTKLFNMLKDYGIGAVITDASGRRDCVHMNLPTPHAFIRFVGNNLHQSDNSRIDEWVQRIKKWTEEGLQSFYFFIHQPDEEYSPRLSKYTIEQFNSVLKLDIKQPKFVNNQNSTLFD